MSTPSTPPQRRNPHLPKDDVRHEYVSGKDLETHEARVRPPQVDNQRLDAVETQARPAGRVTRAIAGDGRFAASHTGVVHAYATFAWTRDGDGADVTAVCGACLPVSVGSKSRAARALVTTRDVTCGPCRGDYSGVTRDATVTSPPVPRVEVLTVRDPDGGTDVTVFVDGAPVEFAEETIDVGWGHQRSEWDAHTRAVADDPDYSSVFKTRVLDARRAWSESKYIEDDQ